MSWSEAQRNRLGNEKYILERYFPNATSWIDPQFSEGGTKVEVLLTSNANYQYQLRIYLTSDFPSSCPKLVVVFPEKLFLQNGEPIPECSDSFHTLTRKDGFHSICHYHPQSWTSEDTLYQIFMKGRLWIEAYEAHLETGKPMDAFLGHQKFTSDPSNPWMEDDDGPNASSQLLSSDDSEENAFSLRQTHPEPRTEEFQHPPSFSLQPYDHLGDRPSTWLPHTWLPPSTWLPPTVEPFPCMPHNTPISSSRFEAMNTPSPPPSPLSPATHTTDQSSSLPRRFRPPPGAINVFAPFRNRCQSEPLTLRPVPRVAPKPNRP